jgi:flagellar biosynthesis/type III secretory pathway protein FliH
MISHNPEQRQLYDARLKLQLDEAARLEGALNQGREEGREEGRAEGELFGQIMLLQELLGIAELTRDELTNLSELRLSEVTEEFKRRLRNRSV